MDQAPSEQSGLYLWLRPMTWREKLSAFAKRLWMRLQALRSFVKPLFVLMLLALLVLLGGCATTSLASRPAANPAPPRLSQPLPETTYSEHVRRLLESWRERLTGTPRM